MKPGLLIFLLAVSNALVWSSLSGRSETEASVFFLDVGQGDSALLAVNGLDILVDAGPGKNVLYELEKVLPKTDKYIDLAVVSHPHADHYGGLEYVLSDYEVGAVVWNGAESAGGFNKILDIARERGIPAVNLSAGDSISSDDLDIKIVYPPEGTDEEILSGNDGSLVMFSAMGNLSGIFTGDIARKAEPLVSAVDFPDVDFLKIPHHGSNASSSSSLIMAANPLVAVMSVGKNSYGLPDEEVFQRFSLAGIPVFRTDEENGIRLLKEDGNLKVLSLE